MRKLLGLIPLTTNQDVPQEQADYAGFRGSLGRRHSPKYGEREKTQAPIVKGNDKISYRSSSYEILGKISAFRVALVGSPRTARIIADSFCYLSGIQT